MFLKKVAKFVKKSIKIHKKVLKFILRTEKKCMPVNLQ